jgi:glutathione S-transferase
MGIARHPAISGGQPWRRAILVKRSGSSRSSRWLDGLVANFAAAGFLGGVFWGFYRTPEHQRNWLAIRGALARCAGHFTKLNRLLEGRRFLLGDALTLADITAGTSLYRYFELEIERPLLPEVECWYRTLQQRDAFRGHVMIPFGELRGRLDY